MQERDVLDVLDAFDRGGIPNILEGGWAIDALIGRQTRPHRDLDLIVDRDDLPAAAQALADMGFVHDSDQRPGPPARLIMVEHSGREIDVHPVLIDDARNGWQELSFDGAWGLYSAEGLRGVGQVGGRRLRCTTPDLQVRHRLGHPLTEKDLHDLRLLREHFGARSIPRAIGMCRRSVCPGMATSDGTSMPVGRRIRAGSPSPSRKCIGGSMPLIRGNGAI